MAEAKVVLTAEDRASSIIDQVTKRLGVFNREGLAMGVTFALMNKGIQLAEQAFNAMIQYIQEGIQKSREFEYSLAQLSVSVNNLGMSMDDMRDNIKDFGLTFGENLNTITNGLRYFIREGYNAADAMNILYETEKLRTAYGDELTDVQNTVNTALEVFNLKASDASYVTRMLNIIMSNTGMSVGQIAQVMSQLAPNIQDANIGLSTFSDYLYTVEKTGVGPKKLISELADAFEDLNFQLENMPTDRTPAIEEKMKTMMGTKQFQQQIEQQYQEQLQTERGGWFDFGENREYKTALENVQAGKTTYETASSYYLNSEKIQKYMDLIRGVTNVELEALQQTSAAARAKEEAEDRVAAAIKKTKNEIQSQSIEMTQLGNDIYKNEQLKTYTVAMHDATQAVQEQQDAIEQLDRVSRRYNLAQQANTLEIMKIQYGAMGRRGGRMTRGEQRAIDEYERLNMGIQIQEQENQIKIGNIQINGLQAALDEQEQIRRDYAQITYNMDMMNLDINLTNQKEKYRTFFNDIAAMRQQILGGNTTSVSSNLPDPMFNPLPSASSAAKFYAYGKSIFSRTRRGDFK